MQDREGSRESLMTVVIKDNGIFHKMESIYKDQHAMPTSNDKSMKALEPVSYELPLIKNHIESPSQERKEFITPDLNIQKE